MIVDVGRLDEFEDGEVTIVAVDGREIGIVRWADEVFALANLCAHQRGPLCRGRLAPRLQASEPGTMELGAGAPVLACPWHGWEFDVRTGLALWDEQYRVRTYPTHVDEGRVVIDTGRHRGTPR